MYARSIIKVWQGARLINLQRKRRTLAFDLCIIEIEKKKQIYRIYLFKHSTPIYTLSNESQIWKIEIKIYETQNSDYLIIKH